MKEKLKPIFEFLKQNREYNKALQYRWYRSIMLPYKGPKERTTSLLYHIANTQSRPKIDSLATFYQSIYQEDNCLNSLASFTKKIGSGEATYNSLYEGMKGQKGWGKKTAALFAKSIFHLHNGKFSPELKIWDDVPSTIEANDKLWLPVDAVIESFFKRLDPATNWNFDKVNKTLQGSYSGHEMEIWDDLWFWGFITQHGSGGDRQFKWNGNKYWALKESDKDSKKIVVIEEKARFFLKISA